MGPTKASDAYTRVPMFPSIYLILWSVVSHWQYKELSESSLFYFLSLFVEPEGRGSVADRNVCEHALLGGMHGGIEEA